MTVYHDQDDAESVEVVATPWEDVDEGCVDESLLNIFRIDDQPRLNESRKPFVLLFDEYYTELYRISEAQRRMMQAERMVFMGTSFSVNITLMALETAVQNSIPVEIVDPQPVQIPYEDVTYHAKTALAYIEDQGQV